MRSLDPAGVADDRVADLRKGPDDAFFADGRLARDKAKWQHDRVAADLHLGVDKRRRRVRDRDATGHQDVEDSLAHNALGLRHLPPIAHPYHLVAVLYGQRVPLP